MIEIYTGVLRGGKSLSAVMRVAKHVCNGGAVWTNLAIERGRWHDDERNADYEGFDAYCLKRFNWVVQEGQLNFLSHEDVARFYEHVPKGHALKPVLVVIDEAPQVFDALDLQQIERELRTYLRHSGKLSVDIVFIAQRAGMLQKRMRDFAQFIWVFTNMGTWRIPGVGIQMPPPWSRYIVQTCFDYNYTKTHCGKWWVLRDDAIYGTYRTRGLHGETVVTAEDCRVDFGNIGKANKGGGDMRGYQVVALGAALVIAAAACIQVHGLKREVSALRETAVAAGRMATNSAPQIAVTNGGGTNAAAAFCARRFAEFQAVVRDMRGGLSVWLDGFRYSPGVVNKEGVCLAVSEDCVTMRDFEGRIYTVLACANPKVGLRDADEGE